MVVVASPSSLPRAHLAGSYRKSRDHVSYVTRSRVNRHVLSYQKVRARQCHLQQPEAPPQPSPRGGSPYLLCLRAFDVAPSPWGRLGWGFYVGWYAPPTTLTELRLHSPELRLPSPLGESWRGASAFYLLSHYTKRGASRRFPPTWCGLLARAPRCSLY